MRTIIQAFHFPVRDKSVLIDNPYQNITSNADTLAQPRSAIFDTYSRLRRKYSEVLTPETFELMKDPLQLAVDILSGE